MSSATLLLQKRICYLGSTISMSLLLMQSLDIFSILWTICAIPLIISILLIPSYTYAMISNECPQIDSFSFYLIQFCSLNFATFVSGFVLLSCLKGDGKISASWISIFICIWYAFLLYFIICIFFLPGLISSKMIREGTMFILWGVTLTVTSVFVALWADYDWRWDSFIVSPIMPSIFISVSWYCYSLVGGPEKIRREAWFYVLGTTVMIAGIFDAWVWIYFIVAVYLIGDWILSELEAKEGYEQIE